MSSRSRVSAQSGGTAGKEKLPLGAVGELGGHGEERAFARTHGAEARGDADEVSALGVASVVRAEDHLVGFALLARAPHLRVGLVALPGVVVHETRGVVPGGVGGIVRPGGRAHESASSPRGCPSRPCETCTSRGRGVSRGVLELADQRDGRVSKRRVPKTTLRVQRRRRVAARVADVAHPRAPKSVALGEDNLSEGADERRNFFSRGRALAPTRWSRGTHSRPGSRARSTRKRAPSRCRRCSLPPRTRTSSARTRRMRFTSGCVPHPPPEMQPHASSRHDSSRSSSLPLFPSPLPRCSATLCWTPRVASSTRAASFVTSRSSASSRSCATPRSPPAWARRPSARSTATSTKRPRRIVPGAFRRWSLAFLQALAPSALRRARTRAQTIASRREDEPEANRVAPSESAAHNSRTPSSTPPDALETASFSGTRRTGVFPQLQEVTIRVRSILEDAAVAVFLPSADPESPELADPTRGFLARAHLAAFYFAGAYSEATKRLAGVRYVFAGQESPEGRPRYDVLGVLLASRLVASAAAAAARRARAFGPGFGFRADANRADGRDGSAGVSGVSGVSGASSSAFRVRDVDGSDLVDERDPPPDPGTTTKRCALCLSPHDTRAATPCGHVFCCALAGWCARKPGVCLRASPRRRRSSDWEIESREARDGVGVSASG